MDCASRSEVLKDFRRMPGVGKRVAQDLWDLGYRAAAQLADADPEDMYRRLCLQAGGHVDRCMLYVFRCAVHFAASEARGETPDPESLKWWRWKDPA
ncbi:MAG: helix-hairpin-helix domain-containing protein [Thermodesulfobacteriota bacterium]